MYIESKQALAEELELKRPAVLAVSGLHNSGKTTLLEKLLPALRSRGLKVGVIKHDGHDFTPDVPGTDSYRLREAGAEVLGVASIFTYGMQKGLDRLAAANVKNHSLTNFDVIADVAAKQNYIHPKDVARLIQFRNNPSDESWIGGKN